MCLKKKVKTFFFFLIRVKNTFQDTHLWFEFSVFLVFAHACWFISSPHAASFFLSLLPRASASFKVDVRGLPSVSGSIKVMMPMMKARIPTMSWQHIWKRPQGRFRKKKPKYDNQALHLWDPHDKNRVKIWNEPKKRVGDQIIIFQQKWYENQIRNIAGV